MKKTYTACFLFVLGSIFCYETLNGHGSGECTKGKGGYSSLHNNPSTCNDCHNPGVVTIDSLGGTTTGINDPIFTKGLATYPTMTTDFICIETLTPAESLTYNVYSLDGRMMKTGPLPSYSAVTFIDLQNLTPAHYIVRVSNESHVASYRIIKE